MVESNIKGEFKILMGEREQEDLFWKQFFLENPDLRRIRRGRKYPRYVFHIIRNQLPYTKNTKCARNTMARFIREFREKKYG